MQEKTKRMRMQGLFYLILPHVAVMKIDQLSLKSLSNEDISSTRCHEIGDHYGVKWLVRI